MKYVDQLEPIAARLLSQDTSAPMSAVATALSQAVSLKRIADVLEKMTDPTFIANFEGEVRKSRYGD